MNIVFNGSERPTLGVEIEVQAVDESGVLETDTAATKILAELDGVPGFKHELLECTVEVITDICPTVDDVRRDLGGKLEQLIDVADGFGYRILCSGTHPFSAWTVRENKWRAARWGLDAEIIRDEEGNLVHLRRSIGDLIERLVPTAEQLGCLDDLQAVNTMVERGTSATRQRERYTATRDLSSVVDLLVEEMKTGTPTPLPDHDLVGGTVVSGDRLPGEHVH